MVRRPHRQLREESLESRCLLAGLVEVDFSDGQLVVRGDEAANVFSIQTAGDPTGETRVAGSFAIVPDAETSINGQEPGVPLVLRDQPLNSVRILPGDGDDVIGLSGLSVADGLKIRNTGGSDTYDILDSEFGTSVRIDGGPDGSAASLSRLRIPRELDKSTPLLARGLQTENTDLVVTDTTIGSSVRISYIDKSSPGLAVEESSPGNVVIERTTIGGKLEITSARQKGSATLGDVVVARELDKASPKIAEALTVENFDVVGQKLSIGGSVDIRFKGSDGGAGHVALSDAVIDGALRIVAAKLPLNVDLNAAQVAGLGFLKIGDIKGEASKADFRSLPDDSGSHVHISASSFGGRLQVESEGPLALNSAATSARDIYIKIGDIKGEASDDTRRSSIEIVGLSTPGDLQIESKRAVDTHVSDSSAKGKFFYKVEISDREPSQLTIDDSQIGGELTVESTGGPLDFSSTGSSARSGVFIKIEIPPASNSANQPVPGRVQIIETSTEGPLSVESNAPVDVSIAQSSARSAFIKIDHIRGEATESKHRGSIEMVSLSLTDSLRVGTTSPSDILLMGSEIGRHADWKVEEGIDASASSLSIFDNTVGGNLRVVSSGAPLDVTLDGTHAKESLSFHYTKVGLRPPGGGISGQSRLAIQDASAGGDLSVTSRQPLEVDVASTTTGGDISLQVDPKREAGSGLSTGVRIAGVETGGDLQVRLVGAADFETTNAKVAGDFYLKIDDIKGEARAQSNIFLGETTVGGHLTVEGSSADDTMGVVGLHVAGRTRIDLNRGDDSLSIRDSIFAQNAVFIGGAGFDTLTLEGVEFGRRSQFLGWQEIIQGDGKDGTVEVADDSAE